MGLVAALEDLSQHGLLVRDDNRAIQTFTDINPRHLQTVLNGRLLHDAMRLSHAEPEDAQEVLDWIRRLGIIDSTAGRTRVEGVVPRGSAPEIKRVPLSGHRVVEVPPMVLRLDD